MSQFVLYYEPICPFSRKVRVFLGEKNLGFDLEEVKVWEREKEFIRLNPANETPVLINKQNDDVVCDSFVICEYIEELHPNIVDLLTKSLFGNDPAERAEVRRIEMWFDKKFYNEVGKYILEEKVYNRYVNKRAVPNTRKLKAAQYNLEPHLRYIEFLLKDRKWLAGEDFTIADITAAAHLSSIDYLGDITWSYYKKAKEWYATIKSKKGFQPLLKDKIEGFKPAKWYDDLDF